MSDKELNMFTDFSGLLNQSKTTYDSEFNWEEKLVWSWSLYVGNEMMQMIFIDQRLAQFFKFEKKFVSQINLDKRRTCEHDFRANRYHGRY